MTASSVNTSPAKQCCWRKGTDNSNMFAIFWSWTFVENPELCGKKKHFRSCIIRPLRTQRDKVCKTHQKQFSELKTISCKLPFHFLFAWIWAHLLTLHASLLALLLILFVIIAFSPTGQALRKLSQITFKSGLVKLLTQVWMLLFRLKNTLI